MRSRGKRHTGAMDFLAGSRRGLLSAGNLLALGGLGWAAYEIWRSKQREAPAARPVVPGTLVEGGIPPPLPAAARSATSTSPAVPAVQQELQRIVDLTLAAARCDGELGEAEYGRILATAREIGAEAMVRNALEKPRPLADIVAGVNDRKQREALYVYAFTVVRADEDVNANERTWLQQLASRLGLDAGTTQRLEKDTAGRIASAATAG